MTGVKRPTRRREQLAAGLTALLWLGLFVGLWWVGAHQVDW